MTTLTKRAATGLALVIALALAACGGSGSGADGMSRPLPDEERTSVAADLSKLNASLLQVGSSSRDPRSSNLRPRDHEFAGETATTCFVGVQRVSLANGA